MRYSDPLARATTPRERPVVERWTDEQFREQRDHDLEPATLRPGAVIRATLGCMLLAALLTSGSLVQIAERQPFGAARDRWLAMAEGVDRVANFLSLNRPADLIADIRGSETRAVAVDTIGADLVAGIPGAEGAGAAPVAEDAVTPAADEGATAPAPTTTAPPEYRTVTGAEPLAVYVAGDSQAEYLGQSLTNLAGDRGGLLAVRNDFRISTGLARPDYFNWPAQLATVMGEGTVEAVVFFVGGNDTQDMEVDGVRLVEGTDEWQAEYQRRAAVTMDLVAGEGHHLFWVLQPPVRDADENDAVRQLNQAIRAAADGRPTVTLLEADVVIAGPGGGYEEFLTTDTGEVERVRQDDGVHLTRAGSEWLARLVYEAVGGVWELQAAPPPTTAPAAPSTPPTTVPG